MRPVKPARLFIGAMLIALLSAWSLSTVQQALAWGTPKDLNLRGVDCGGTNCQIFSVRLAAEGNRVHMIYGQKDTKQLYYNRGTTAADGTVSWESARVLAKNVTVLNVAAWDIVADANGTIHVAYYSDGTIYYIKNAARGDLGNWTSPEGISSSSRAYGLSIKLDTQNTPYVAWTAGISQGSSRFAYRRSDGSWNVRNPGLRTYFIRITDLAIVGGGDSATVHIMYEYQRKQAGPFDIYYVRGTRDGTLSASNFSGSFSNASCSCERPRIVADPTTNALYAGFVGGGISSGYFWGFTRSTNNGESWSSLTRVRAGGSSLWADETPMVAINNTVYMDLPTKAWNGSGFSGWGSVDIRYNAASNTFTGPIDILNYQNTNGKLDRNIDYGINEVAKVAVWIRNYTDGPGYNSDPGGVTPGPTTPTGQVNINNGVSTTNNSAVTVNLTNVIGSPTSMRVAVDTPVSNSTPIEPFQATFTRTISNLSVCQHTINVALINEAGTSPTYSANIVVDAAVQANVVVGNPYKRGNAVVFSQVQDTTQVVSDGDSQYTRVPAIYTEINGAAECSSLKQVSIGRTAGAYSYTQPIGSNFYASPLFLPGSVAVGPNNVALEVQDSVGNSQVYTRTVYYDPNAPVLTTPGALAIQPSTTGPNILTTLTFTGSVVTDDQYPNGYWGLWIANSRTPVTNPISDSSLVWSTVQRPNTSQDFSLANWSVLAGLPLASQTAGQYYVYVRFLDGAGNPTNGVLTASVTLNAISKPSLELPVVIKR